MLHSVKKLHYIFNFITFEVMFGLETITFGHAPVFERFSPEDFIIVESPQAMSPRSPLLDPDLDKENKKAVIDAYRNNVDNGIVFNDVKYVPMCTGSSGFRTCEYLFATEQTKRDYLEWATGGLIDFSGPVNMTTSKLSKYAALPFSTCRTFPEAFGDDSQIHEVPPEKWLVLPDVEISVGGEFDDIVSKSQWLQVNGKWTKPVHDTVVRQSGVSLNKISDGLILLIINDTSWTTEQRDAFACTQEAFSVRDMFVKGCCQPVFRTALNKMISEGLINATVHDAWGREVNLKDVELITFKSVVKCSKLLKSWQQYVEAHDKYGHHMWVCVKSHNRRTGMPYQQFQTLYFEDWNDVQKLADDVARQVDNEKCYYQFGNKQIKECVRLYPSLLKDDMVHEKMESGYLAFQRRVFSGQIPNITRTHFVMPDIFAILTAALGNEMKFMIKKRCVISRSDNEDDVVTVTRNPHLDNAHMPRKVQAVDYYWRGLYIGNAVFISAQDNLMLAIQADFDGDKVKLCKNPLINKAAVNAWIKYDQRILKYAAADANGEKSCENYTTELANIYKYGKPAEIGKYAIALQKIWNERGETFNNTNIALLTKDCNLCVDAAVHGGKAGSVESDALLKVLSDVPQPGFACYTHAKIINGKIQLSKGQIQPMSHVDAYAEYLKYRLPKTFDDLLKKHLPMSSLPNIDWHMLTSDPKAEPKQIPGLCFYNNKTKERGMFNNLASMSADSIMKDTRKGKSFLDEYSAAVKAELTRFLADSEYTLSDACDCIAHYLFDVDYTDSRHYIFNEMKEVFFTVFGKEIADNLCRNLYDNHCDISDDMDDGFDFDDDDE